MTHHELRHHTVDANGVRIHVAEQGTGPLVLLVHGFPELWYSWRHQLPALAAAGYRAAAIDVRGYGRSSKPAAIEAYRMTQMVGDIVALVGALGEQRATLVGHDWGAPIVWHSALVRPDLFRGVAGISVPYAARSSRPPSRAFRDLVGDRGEFYIEVFQTPGRAEAEIEEDVRSWLLGFYWSASGGVSREQVKVAFVPTGGRLRDGMAFPSELPDWLPEAALEVYVTEFERTGLTGGLNRYRNMDRDWQDFAAYHGCPITIPALFLGGSKDGPTLLGKSAIARFEHSLPRLTRSVILDGCGHWVQQERPQETNQLLLEFLEHVHAPA